MTKNLEKTPGVDSPLSAQKRFLPWAIGAASVFTICALLYSGQQFSNGLVKARLYQELVQNLEEGAQVNSLLIDKKFRTLLPPTIPSIRQAVDVLALLHDGQISRAKYRLSRKGYPAFGIKRNLSNKLNAILALEQQSSEQREHLRQLESSERTQLKLYGLLKEDLEILLLGQVDSESSIAYGSRDFLPVPNRNEIAYYVDGILKGLPKIQDIPDGLQDGKALRGALIARAGSSENLKTSKPSVRQPSKVSSHLKGRLETLQKSSQENQEKLLLLLDTSDNLKKSLLEMEKRGNEIRREAVQMAREVVAHVGTPQVPPQVKLSYNTARSLVSFMGISLPELRSTSLL